MMNISNIFKKRQRPTSRELLFQEYANIHQQHEQVSNILKWLGDCSYDERSFDPWFFSQFFSRVHDLPFEDVPAEACATLFYFDGKKQRGTIGLSWKEASDEYHRLRAIDWNMHRLEEFVTPGNTANPYLQSIYYARQTSQKLRIYLDSKETSLKERLDALMLELFPA